MAIEKKFKKVGNSWGLVIPNELLALLEINPEENKVILDSIDKEIIIKQTCERHVNERKFVKTSTVWAIIFPTVAFEILGVDPAKDKISLSLKDKDIIVKKL